MRGQAIDRFELHKSLFEQADRFGKIEIYQKALAAGLGITQASMSLIIKELSEQGKIRKISSKRRNVGIYLIRDPAEFEHEFDTYTVPGIGIERCATCGAIFESGPHYPRVAT